MKPSQVRTLFRSFLVCVFVVCIIDTAGLFWIMGPHAFMPWLLLPFCVYFLLSWLTKSSISSVYLVGYVLALTANRLYGGAPLGQEIWLLIFLWLLVLSVVALPVWLRRLGKLPPPGRLWD